MQRLFIVEASQRSGTRAKQRAAMKRDLVSGKAYCAAAPVSAGALP